MTTMDNEKPEIELNPTSQDVAKKKYGTVEDGEQVSEKEIKYPKSVFFIICNELCERFSYYGMRTILAIYLQKKLRYDENSATIIFHLFVMVCYFFPIFGAIIADSFLGKFRTIVYLSIIYTIGNIVLATSSASVLDIPHRELTLVGLLLIATGTGGIKPCVSSFGGDQFVVPQQEKQLQQFFSIFYFSINIGSMLGTFITPVLRQDVHCLGEDTCFPLAFALPAVLMVLALIIFISGKRLYKIKKPQGNVIVDVIKCVWYALKKRLGGNENKKTTEHWLDLAADKYDKKLIADTKIILSIALVLTPTICFSALFEQQGSSWTFQASRMDGTLWEGSYIKPDQVHIVNPVMVLLFIPLFQKHIYPFLAKLHIKTPLQKMSLGGILAAVAFFVSGLLELRLQPTYAVLPTHGEAQLRLFNGYNCSIDLYSGNGTIVETIKPFDVLELKTLQVSGNNYMEANLTMYKSKCPSLTKDLTWSGELSTIEKTATSYIISGTNKKLSVQGGVIDNIEKSDYGKPKISVIYNIPVNTYITLENRHDPTSKLQVLLNSSEVYLQDEILASGVYILTLNGTIADSNIRLLFGGVYKLMINTEDDKINYKLFTITPPNSVHMIWILPQFFILTVSEVLFSITGLEFAFMQAPHSMKSVSSSLWLLTTSLGNLMVVFIEELLHSDNRAIQFFSYGFLMLVVMGIFILLAMRYTYVQIVTEVDEANSKCKTNQGFENDELKND